MNPAIVLYLKVRSGRCGSSGFCWILEKNKEKEKGERVWVLIKINLALVFVPLLANRLSLFFTVLINHHKHWCCAKEFTHLVQSEKAAAAIAVMSSTSARLLSHR